MREASQRRYDGFPAEYYSELPAIGGKQIRNGKNFQIIGLKIGKFSNNLTT